ncbi:DUF6119 family protein [Streptomyces sp. WAC01526]|uniref:DUF6119 family protein n=1 Tax=Streptomyces sp. WAC01526 TaxID=2588709 RepID=UPI0011E025C6|nr:DUF6119 family protein [Streptomyces sp. WAC01526]
MVTLNRLVGVKPTVEAMRTALEGDQLDGWDAQLHDASHGTGVPSVLLVGGKGTEAPWCGSVERSSGIRAPEFKRRTAALQLMAIDDEVYAVGHDDGFRLLPDEFRDRTFGLSFVIRQIDPQQVRGLVASTLGQARTDIAVTPGGIPLSMLGIRAYDQLVSRIGGYLDSIELTYARYGRGKAATAEGGCGLRLRLGVDAADLIADIREIARICRDRKPRRGLEFVEHFVPVRDPKVREALDVALDDVLGCAEDGRVALAVPEDLVGVYGEAARFGVKIGRRRANGVDDLSVAHLLDPIRVHRPGSRLTALRGGKVHVYGPPESDGAASAVATGAQRWIEANISLDERRFCLWDQSWYEIGAAHEKEIRATIASVIRTMPSWTPPPWPRGADETTYNQELSKTPEGRGFLNLDRAYVKNPLKRRNVLEVCDHLAPDNTLVLVKPAHGRSGPLSHLFNQGVVTVQMLQNSASVRREFTKLVREKSGSTQRLPEDFTPRRIIFAIHLKPGTALTPDTLFGFSQVTLAQTVRTLQQWGVTVEVIGISDAEAGTIYGIGGHVAA